MKRPSFLNIPISILLIATLATNGLASPFDVNISQKNSSNNAWVPVIVAPTASSVLAFDSGKVPISTQSLTLSSITGPAATNLTLTAGSGNQGVVIVGTGTGQTASAVNTGGLRSANFGLSTVLGGASYFGGLVNSSSRFYASGGGGGFWAGASDLTLGFYDAAGAMVFRTSGINQLTLAATTGAATFAGAVTTGGRLQVNSALTSYIAEVREDAASVTGLRTKNDSTSASAYSQLAINAFGNSWGFRMGSLAANSNALEFISDITAPVVRFSMTPAGAATFAGAVTAASLATTQTAAAAAAVVSTHKVPIVLNGVTYYMLLTNVP